MSVKVEDSILNSIKKLLGITPDCTQFDIDIIMHINSAFNTLTEIGAGPDDGFEITDDSSVWSEFTENNKLLNQVKTYIYKKVRLIFDPPQSSGVADSMKNMIVEDEFRISVIVDSNGGDNSNVDI